MISKNGHTHLVRSALLTASGGLLAAALMAGPAAQSARAADKDGNYMIRGAGTVSCSQYLEATPEQKKYAETWWAGYVTAMNRATPRTYHLLGQMSTADANRWLENYCRNNPDRRLAIAVHEMLRAAYPNRLQASPK